jgi:hypothetical protein
VRQPGWRPVRELADGMVILRQTASPVVIVLRGESCRPTSDIHAFWLNPLDLENRSALLVRLAPWGRHLAHKTPRRDSGIGRG